MTFYHFANCVALAYVPYFLTYKFSGLPEYGAFWKCMQVGGMYMLTQLCKLLLLATFFPTSDGPLEGTSLFSETVKASIDFADIIGLTIMMGRIAGSGHIKVLITGLGWAAADLVSTQTLPLWVGARGLEFDWKYLQMSLGANVNLVHHLCLALLVWLWSRHDLAATSRPLVAFLMVLCVYRHLLPHIFLWQSSSPQGFLALASSATTTFCTALVSLNIFVSHSPGTSRGY